MCNVINLDVVALMYIVGGGFLGWFGMKAFRSYNKNIVAKKTDESIDSIGDKESFSTHGN